MTTRSLTVRWDRSALPDRAIRSVAQHRLRRLQERSSGATVDPAPPVFFWTAKATHSPVRIARRERTVPLAPFSRSHAPRERWAKTKMPKVSRSVSLVRTEPSWTTRHTHARPVLRALSVPRGTMTHCRVHRVPIRPNREPTIWRRASHATKASSSTSKPNNVYHVKQALIVMREYLSNVHPLVGFRRAGPKVVRTAKPVRPVPSDTVTHPRAKIALPVPTAPREQPRRFCVRLGPLVPRQR
jgi:hypothetical protein